MKKIYLKTKEEVFVDDGDFVTLNSYKWYNCGGYAMRKYKKLTFFMHREVMGLQKGDGKMIDHINRNKLDNRKENLKLTDFFLNNRNMDRVSEFPGTYWQKDKKLWRAQFQKDGKVTNLGNFKYRKDAIKAYELAFSTVVVTGLPSVSLQ